MKRNICCTCVLHSAGFVFLPSLSVRHSCGFVVSEIALHLAGFVTRSKRSIDDPGFGPVYQQYCLYLFLVKRKTWGNDWFCGMWLVSIISPHTHTPFFSFSLSRSGLRSKSAGEWLWRSFLLCSCSISRGLSLRRLAAVRSWSRTLITLWTWRSAKVHLWDCFTF